MDLDAHLQEEIARLNVHIVPRGSIRKMSIQPTLEDKIRKAQRSDKDLMEIRMQTGENKAPDFRVDSGGTLWYKNRICVPQKGDFWQIVMDEAHNLAYSIHQDVYGFKTKILVEGNEGGYCTVCRPL